MDAQATLLAPLTAGDRDAFERIVGSPPEDLLREVASLPSDRYWEVFSVAKFLNWPELNRAGLHVFRTLLGTRRVEAAVRRRGLWEMPEGRAFRERGVAVREDFLVGDDLARYRATGRMPRAAREEVARLVARCIGSDTFEGGLGIQELEHDPADPQLDLHLDTFHPTVKVWYYPDDVALEDGPLHVVPASHVLTPAKLEWVYECSLIAADPDHPEHAARCGSTRTGSFRLDTGGDGRAALERLGLGREEPMTGRANTLFLVDTSAFHRRGVIAGGRVRRCARGSHRVSPFEGLRHPVRRRLARSRARLPGLLGRA